jgi:hypothetical protein
MIPPARGKPDLRPAWLMPALVSGAATLVAVTVLNLVLGDDSDGLDRHRMNAPVPASSRATTTVSEPAVSGPIHLQPDGLDVVAFGQPPDDVTALLSKRLGRPDEDTTQPCQQVNARSRWVRWADLSVIFSAKAFVAYIEGIHFPRGRPALDFSTAKGLSPGDTVDRLHRLYGPVPIRQGTPQPGQIATKLFTISDDRTSDKLSGVLENQGNKTVVTAIFAGELC